MSEARAGGKRAGLLVSLEGVDGAGKSTQAAALSARLRSEGHRVLSVREPGETVFGELVRDLVLGHRFSVPVDPWAETLAFVAARAQLVREVVVPALATGHVVVADRFVDSTLAYQGFGRGLGEEALRRLHRDACGDLWPDLTLLLTLPAQTAAARRGAAELPLDRMEVQGAEFRANVARGFAALAAAEPQRIVAVDAGRPLVEVSDAVLAAVLARLAAVPA